MAGDATTGNGRIEKVSIIISKGSLEGIYPGLIMANGARAEGIEANLFFTFFGLDAIRKDRYEKIKVATVGNPGMHMATWIGAVPGFSAVRGCAAGGPGAAARAAARADADGGAAARGRSSRGGRRGAATVRPGLPRRTGA